MSRLVVASLVPFLHEIPCHHTLEEYLDAYMEAGGLKDQPRGPLFRTFVRGTGVLSTSPLPPGYCPRRAKATGIGTAVCCHTLRATGITAFFKNGGGTGASSPNAISL